MLAASRFLRHMRARLWLWLAPMLVFFASLAWLAWRLATAPASPFAYEVL